MTMEQISLSRAQVTAIAVVFALLLIVGFWFKLNPSFQSNSYYQNAAKLQSQEYNVLDETKGHTTPTPPPAGDQAYQPESGKN
jgi:hypothetical protein